MANLDLEQVLTAIETPLKTIRGLNVSDVAPAQITPPHAIVGVPPIASYQTGLGGRPTLEPTITVYTSTTLDRAGQLLLARYASPAGPGSIPAAIAADRRLGGVVDDCLVRSFDWLDIQEIAFVGFYGGRFTLTVLI